jgi:hypothetical protein
MPARAFCTSTSSAVILLGPCLLTTVACPAERASNRQDSRRLEAGGSDACGDAAAGKPVSASARLPEPLAGPYPAPRGLGRPGVGDARPLPRAARRNRACRRARRCSRRPVLAGTRGPDPGCLPWVATALPALARRLPRSPAAVAALRVRYADGRGVLHRLLQAATARELVIGCPRHPVSAGSGPGTDAAASVVRAGG